LRFDVSLDVITDRVLARVANGAAIEPLSLIFLLRQYRASGREDVCEALGQGLAAALDLYGGHQETPARVGWLRAFTEGAALSDDVRLSDAVRELVGVISGGWPSQTTVDEASESIDACLAASHLADPSTIVQRSIDELERVVAAAYHPGAGVAHVMTGNAHGQGGLLDHVRLASALLTAFGATGRLPYSMLAEELMQSSRGDLSASADVVAMTEAARVLCRLASLHDDADYRSAAVVATGADYRADAQAVLERAAHLIDAASVHAALYGIALAEWQPDLS
jgi:hypothetical protein